jgi:hypothetical protein
MKISAVAIALCFCGVAFATDLGKPKANGKTGAVKDSSPRFAAEPLDPNVELLPANYAGHDCRAIAAKLKTINTKKGEFETTEAYESRLQPPNIALPGSLKGGDLLAFVVPIPDIYASYNADRGEMKVSRSLSQDQNYDAPSHKSLSFIVSERQLDKSSYVGSNAFGHKVRVERTVFSICAVTWETSKYIVYPKIEAAIRMPPEEAKDAKPGLSFLIIGKLAAPFISGYRYGSEPKIDFPYEVIKNGDALSLDLQGIWVLDRRTGKVFEKAIAVTGVY